MANPFLHVELKTTDVDRAKKFYGQCSLRAGCLISPTEWISHPSCGILR